MANKLLTTSTDASGVESIEIMKSLDLASSAGDGAMEIFQ